MWSMWNVDWASCGLYVCLCLRKSVANTFPTHIDISVCVRGTAWVVTREPVTSGHGPPPRPLLREHTAVSFSPGLSYPRSPVFW